MSAPRKWAAERHAHADGADIQYRHNGTQDWRDCEFEPVWCDNAEYRVKPAEPERAKVETLMTDEKILELWRCKMDRIGTSIPDDRREIINAALAHAIEAGQVVPMAGVRATAQGLYERQRAPRDLAIADAVRMHCDMDAEDIDLPTIIAKVQP